MNYEKIVESILNCVDCGSDKLIFKDVSRIISCNGTSDVVVLRVKAEVCLNCGQTYFSSEDSIQFTEIRRQLKSNLTENFKKAGVVYEVS